MALDLQCFSMRGHGQSDYKEDETTEDVRSSPSLSIPPPQTLQATAAFDDNNSGYIPNFRNKPN